VSSDRRLDSGKGHLMRDVLVMVGMIAAYFALQIWILPRLGVST
jgi:hypothetical protein